MNPPSRLSLNTRNHVNLDEPWRAIREADRCLGCYEAPCIFGCPTRINIPEFIGRIRTENLEGAYQTLVQANPLPAICGLVCPTEYLCEGQCVHTKLSGRPVAIAALQRFVCNQAQTKEILESTREAKVAVVGGGPGGIACALGLRRLGYPVDLFDAHQKPGGLLNYSIPNYRLPDSAVANELTRLVHSGIRFYQGEAVEAGRLRSLIAEYQAVYLGIGLSGSKEMLTPGSQLKGVWSALDYLERMRRVGRSECQPPDLKERVVVIGGGNVALDAACVAANMGARNVTVIYRRTHKEMPAWESEFQDALGLGVEFRWLADVDEILGEAGGTVAVRLHAMRLLSDRDSSGRLRVEPIAGSEEVFACDAVILAVGQALEFEGLASLGIEIDADGLIKTDPQTSQTSHPKVFAGGDAIRGGSYVVQAIADGMSAARAIHRSFSGEERS
jgi:glutamate synthase (NADPH/NADH) small chain